MNITKIELVFNNASEGAWMNSKAHEGKLRQLVLIVTHEDGKAEQIAALVDGDLTMVQLGYWLKSFGYAMERWQR